MSTDYETERRVAASTIRAQLARIDEEVALLLDRRLVRARNLWAIEAADGSGPAPETVEQTEIIYRRRFGESDAKALVGTLFRLSRPAGATPFEQGGS
jgi:hypothetical protein